MPFEPALLASLAGLFVIAGLMPSESMQFDRQAILGGELWRLWTGQFCHWSSLHLAGNMAALAALSLIGGRGMRRWLALLPVISPLLSLTLLGLLPELQHYRGASGLVAVLAIGVATEGGLIGCLVAVAWLAKLIIDALYEVGSPLLPAGITTTWQAHLAGSLLGLAIAAGFHRYDHRGSPGA